MKRLILAAVAGLALAACEPMPPYGPPPPGYPPPPPAYPPTGTPPPGYTGGICSGIAGFACNNPGDFCQLPTGQCAMPDAAGVCRPRPDVCYELYQPVCGCDGRTYGNACQAEQAGTSVLHGGACR